MKSAVFIQPCFFPWRGQFDLFSKGDVAVLLDDVQYVRRSWYNRNKIWTPNGQRWITVPVYTKGQYHAKIKDIRIQLGRQWKLKILGQLQASYSKYKSFSLYFDEIRCLLNKEWKWLTDLDQASLEWSFAKLGRNINFLRSSELDIHANDPVNRLILICKSVGADKYLSGPSARNYIGKGMAFSDAGITLEWMEYPQYRRYPRPFGNTNENLSILDLFFCVGKDATKYIWEVSDD